MKELSNPVQRKRSPIYYGINLDKNKKVDFNCDENNSDSDILRTAGELSGEFDSDNVRYIYGYMFTSNASNADKKIVQNYINELGSSGELFSDDVDEFVDYGVLSLDAYCSFDDFEAAVYFESYKNFSILNTVDAYFSEYLRSRCFIDFKTLKQTYENVEFDVVKAEDTLRAQGFPEQTINKNISLITEKFDTLKHSEELFKIKEFIPEEIRQNFSDFLQFKSKEELETYQILQGVNVIIYNDFIPSDATVREVARYLRAMHDENTLTVFVLIKQ